VATILALVGISVGFVASRSSPRTPRRPPANQPTTTTTTAKSVTSARCPLTDTPPPGGVVPRRPALLVKIGNEPGTARPQSGLNEADIVFDTPAEGFIMRYVAVYQCNNAGSIGPTRSVRWVDWNMIAPEFRSPILAFAGGINPNVNGLQALPWLSGANLLEASGEAAGVRISSRFPPDNLYTSTPALYALFKSKKTPPPAVFDYSRAVPHQSRRAKSIGINFSYGTDAVWQWDAQSRHWMHTYSGVPDIDVLSGKQVWTNNIVIEIVHYTFGPYSEHGGPGNGDVESQLVGSGPGYVARNGRVVKVTWHRPNTSAKTTFTNAAGQAVRLTPGRTWVEIDPDTQAYAPGGITITY